MPRGHRDPTGDRASANADKAAKSSRGRRLEDEFPEMFKGLNDYGRSWVATHAWGLAGNNPWAITADHLQKARAEYGAKE